MEGLIILFVIISAIQKIVEKVQEARKSKLPTEARAPEPQGQRTQTEGNSSEPFDIFRDWEKIFFPKETDDAVKDAENPWYEQPSTQEQPVSIRTQPVSVQGRTEIVEEQRMTPQYQRATKERSRNSGIMEQRTSDDDDLMLSKEMQLKLRAIINQESLRRGVILSEVLGAPKSSLHWSKHQRSSLRG